MEVIAAASSVAGLLSLAGQCILGAQKLHSFYNAISTASKTAEAFLKDINSLIRTLHDVKELLEKIEARRGGAMDKIALTSLRLHLEDCDRLLEVLLKKAEPHGATDGDGLRSRFRRFWSAVNQDSMPSVRWQIQTRRLEVIAALATLGRTFDLEIMHSTQTIITDVQETKVSTQAMLDVSANANDTLQRIANDIGSMRSRMSSMSSGFSSGSVHSSLENKPYESTKWGWRCDAWKSIEDLFRPLEPLDDGTEVLECRFCDLVFYENIDNKPTRENRRVNIREEHVKTTHQLTACYGTASTFAIRMKFHGHLFSDHNAKLDSVGMCTSGLDNACLVKPGCITPSPEYERIALQEQNISSSTADFDLDAEGEETHELSLMGHSWDATLLGEFSSPRDRINRWLLHVLGSHADHADIHRQFYTELKGAESLTFEGSWNRLILKYWFLDEAALGVDLREISKEVGDVELELVNSSLCLSARHSVQHSSNEGKPASSKGVAFIHRNLRHRQSKPKPTARRRRPFVTPKTRFTRSRGSVDSMGSTDERLHSSMDVPHDPDTSKAVLWLDWGSIVLENIDLILFIFTGRSVIKNLESWTKWIVTKFSNPQTHQPSGAK